MANEKVWVIFKHGSVIFKHGSHDTAIGEYSCDEEAVEAIRTSYCTDYKIIRGVEMNLTLIPQK